MSTWPNRGGLRRPLRGGPEERENPKTQTANLSIRSTRSDSSQQASTKPGVVQMAEMATLVRNTCRAPCADAAAPTFELLTTATAHQQRAMALIQAIHP